MFYGFQNGSDDFFYIIVEDNVAHGYYQKIQNGGLIKRLKTNQRFLVSRRKESSINLLIVTGSETGLVLVFQLLYQNYKINPTQIYEGTSLAPTLIVSNDALEGSEKQKSGIKSGRTGVTVN